MGEGSGGVVTPEAQEIEVDYGLRFWTFVVIGWVTIGVATMELLSDHGTHHAGRVFVYMVGLDLVHDLVLAPLIVLLGVVLFRLIPRGNRQVLQIALIISGTLALYSYPFVRGFGRLGNNPSLLPNNYGRGLALLLAIVWSVAACALATRFVLQRRSHG